MLLHVHFGYAREDRQTDIASMIPGRRWMRMQADEIWRKVDKINKYHEQRK